MLASALTYVLCGKRVCQGQCVTVTVSWAVMTSTPDALASTTHIYCLVSWRLGVRDPGVALVD